MINKNPFIAGLALAAALIVIPTISNAEGTNSATASKLDLLKTCPVSGEKLGEMGKPYTFEYQGQEVKLCCTMCKADFDKDPQKYLKKIQDAAKKNTP